MPNEKLLVKCLIKLGELNREERKTDTKRLRSLKKSLQDKLKESPSRVLEKQSYSSELLRKFGLEKMLDEVVPMPDEVVSAAVSSVEKSEAEETKSTEAERLQKLEEENTLLKRLCHDFYNEMRKEVEREEAKHIPYNRSIVRLLKKFHRNLKTISSENEKESTGRKSRAP